MSEVEGSGQGLAGWLLTSLRSVQTRRLQKEASRQMKVLETLVLGPKKQLLLIGCGEDRFLVGTTTEGVTSITRVGAGETR